MSVLYCTNEFAWAGILIIYSELIETQFLPYKEILNVSDCAISAKLKNNYDGYYGDGPSDWRAVGAIDKVENIRALCGALPRARVLDIGSGDGALLNRLSCLQFSENLYAVEVSASAVETTKRRNIPYVQDCRLFDGYQLPYPDEYFSLSILSHVLEHVEHPRRLLCEAARVSQYLFIEVPLEDTVRLRKNYVFNGVGHINFYSWKTVRLLMQTCDLEVISQTITNPSQAVYKYVSATKGPLKHVIKEVFLRASTHVASRIFTYHCSMLCRKVRA